MGMTSKDELLEDLFPVLLATGSETGAFFLPAPFF